MFLYTLQKIIRYKHRSLAELAKGSSRGVNPEYARRLKQILDVINIAQRPEDIAVPELRLHPLTGDMKGYWSVTVRANWRVIFRFAGADVTDVELIDYH